MDSDMDLLLDMMPDENIAYENVEPNKTNEYYQGHAEHILKQLDSVDHYFHFVNTILKNYHTLSEEQQQIIQDRLGIKPKIVEKVVIKEKIVYKKEKKARVNAFDDY
jgi:Mg2+ and Co2+ transporter CorA